MLNGGVVNSGVVIAGNVKSARLMGGTLIPGMVKLGRLKPEIEIGLMVNPLRPTGPSVSVPVSR
ncbi:hypothetical protein NJB1907E19_23550 [Mycobacterium marinum]|nr:hypothetical protein NJB1728e24_00500 [Mycobacterium marinum]GJO38920.1 hypothetical protein NJB1907E19_23550 [Mycobacterium marinum]